MRLPRSTASPGMGVSGPKAVPADGRVFQSGAFLPSIQFSSAVQVPIFHCDQKRNRSPQRPCDELLSIEVGATRRLLNFSAKVWPVGMPFRGGGWITVNRSRIDSYGLALMPSTFGNASGRQVLESRLDSEVVNAWIK